MTFLASDKLSSDLKSLTVGEARFISLNKKRKVLNPNPQYKHAQKLLLGLKRNHFDVHPSIYSTKGRSHIDVLQLAIQKKSAGHYIACCDIKTAFQNTRIDQLKKILRSDGIPEEYDDFLGLSNRSIRILNSKKTYRGLAQGFPASSLLYAGYLSKALYRFTSSRPYNCIAVWCDDFYVFGKTRKAVAKSLKDFKWQLKKLDQISKVHGTNSKKAPQILSPAENWPVLGFQIGEL